MKRYLLAVLLLAGCGQPAAVKEYMTGLGPCQNHVAEVEVERARVYPGEVNALEKNGCRYKFTELPGLKAKLGAAMKESGAQGEFMATHAPAPEDCRGVALAYLTYLDLEGQYFSSLSGQITVMEQITNPANAPDDVKGYIGTLRSNGEVCAKTAVKVADAFKSLEETDKKYR